MKEKELIICYMKKIKLAVFSCLILSYSSIGFAAFNDSVNLVEVNPGFEDGSQGWNTGGGTIDDTEASEGFQSGKLESTGSGNSRDWRSQGYFNITPGHQYLFSFDYKTEAGSTGKPQYRFRFFGNGQFKGEAQGDLSLTEGDWASVTREYICPDGAEYFDILYSASNFGTFTGSVWFDNAAVNPYVDDRIAINPVPADDTVDVPVNQILSWGIPFAVPAGYTLYLAKGADPNWVEVPATWTTNDPNETSYDPQVDFEAGATYSWRVDTSVTGDVWQFTTIPPKAYAADPTDGETGVSPLQICSWGSVPGAISYDVYWGTDEELVIAGDASMYQGTQSSTTYSPEMDFTTQYFWRIDTNLSESISFGDVWSYTTDVRICDPVMAGDINDDCVVNMEDFAILAADWLSCTLSNGICQ